MRNGPTLWNAILHRLPADAVIAGGAVRDFMLGVEPKDIDVFMKPHGWIENRPAGFHRIDDSDERAIEYTTIRGIESVSHGRLYDIEVDVIEMTDKVEPDKLVAGFDFAIARCWYDGQIHDTIEAAMDRRFRNVTLLVPTRPERARKRFERFNARMGGTFTYRERA